MSTAPQPSPASVRVELLAPKHYSEEFPLILDFLAYKKCCWCIPASAGETEAGWTKKREPWPADKLSLSAVAIDESTDQVVGFVHCSGHGHPCDMHKPKEGEIYVDEICVDKAFRRRGIGTQLMNWVEGVARERSGEEGRAANAGRAARRGSRAAVQTPGQLHQSVWPPRRGARRRVGQPV